MRRRQEGQHRAPGEYISVSDWGGVRHCQERYRDPRLPRFSRHQPQAPDPTICGGVHRLARDSEPFRTLPRAPPRRAQPATPPYCLSPSCSPPAYWTSLLNASHFQSLLACMHRRRTDRFFFLSTHELPTIASRTHRALPRAGPAARPCVSQHQHSICARVTPLPDALSSPVGHPVPPRPRARRQPINADEQTTLP